MNHHVDNYYDDNDHDDYDPDHDHFGHYDYQYYVCNQKYGDNCDVYGNGFHDDGDIKVMTHLSEAMVMIVLVMVITVLFQEIVLMTMVIKR